MKMKERKYLSTIEIECEKEGCDSKEQSGGCFKHEVLMNQQPNSLDVQNVNTLGETIA